MTWKTRWFAGFSIAMVLLAAGCQHPVRSAAPAGADAESLPVRTVLVLPFVNLSDIFGPHNQIRCPVCGQSHETGEVSNEAVSGMNRYLVAGMEQQTEYRVLPPDTVQGRLSIAVSKGGTKLYDHDLFVETARSVGADLFMVGYLFRFRERVGAAYSVEKPASIAFGLHLVDVKSGKKIWSKHFDETQVSLSENLFAAGKFFRRGGGWITAMQMAEQSLDEILQTLPKS